MRRRGCSAQFRAFLLFGFVVGVVRRRYFAVLLLCFSVGVSTSVLRAFLLMVGSVGLGWSALLGGSVVMLCRRGFPSENSLPQSASLTAPSS